MNSRQLCKLFNTDLGDGLFQCRKCVNPPVQRRQTAGTGYSNLLSAKHPGYAAEAAEFQTKTVTTLEAYNFIDDVTSNIFDWRDWIVARNLPLCEVENQKTRKIVKMKPICVRTLKAAMQHVAKRIGVALADEIGTSFGLMFDGWSNNTMHFVGIFAVFARSTPSGDSLCQRLLAISPLEDGQTADAHIEYLKTILGVYHKKIAMVQFLVADNCSTNQSIASKLEIPMVGCASHRFNLAVNLYLEEHKDLVNPIQNLMIHLRHHKNTSQLAKATNLVAIKSNRTRWSSVFNMVQRMKA